MMRSIEMKNDGSMQRCYKIIHNSKWFNISNSYPTFYLAVPFEVKEEDGI
jgi:hypothetical protein